MFAEKLRFAETRVWGLAEPRENPLLLILLRVLDDKIRYTVSHSIKQVSYRYHKVKF